MQIRRELAEPRKSLETGEDKKWLRLMGVCMWITSRKLGEEGSATMSLNMDLTQLECVAEPRTRKHSFVSNPSSQKTG